MEFSCKICGMLLVKQENPSRSNRFNFPIEMSTGKIHDIHYRQSREIKQKEEARKAVKQIRYPRIKASAIICPEPDCNMPCVQEGEHTCVDLFVDHVRTEHGLNPTAYCINMLKSKVEYLQNNARIHYIDPFIGLDWHDIFKTSYIDELKK